MIWLLQEVMTSTHAQQALIDGSTRLFAIIGDPITQVKSPEKLNPRFAALGMNAVLIPVNVKPDSFDETVRGLMAVGNLDGIIITVPYKNRILPLLDHVLPMAAKVGAANAMRREADSTWSGEMFDGTGMVRGLREAAIQLEGRKVQLIGAGGAGSAVAVAMADAGAKTMTIFDVDTGKAKALADRVAAAFPGCAVRAGPILLSEHDTLINATPIGMTPGDGLPVPVDGLNSDMLVIDVIIKPETTPLLDHARALGCRTFNGRLMLDGQAEELVRFFSIRERS
jgi:shikimate dehydrogenase